MPTCEQVNEDYDDDTVLCNDPESINDYSYDLSALNPNQAPMRCKDWNVSMMNLEAMDPLYVCIEWHRLYGVLRPQTRAPTMTPTQAPSK